MTPLRSCRCLSPYSPGPWSLPAARTAPWFHHQGGCFPSRFDRTIPRRATIYAGTDSLSKPAADLRGMQTSGWLTHGPVRRLRDSIRSMLPRAGRRRHRRRAGADGPRIFQLGPGQFATVELVRQHQRHRWITAVSTILRRPTMGRAGSLVRVSCREHCGLLGGVWTS